MNEETNETTEQEENLEGQGLDELALLKQRADIMGISYHPNIGVDKLKAKITEKTEGGAAADEGEQEETPKTDAQLAQQAKMARRAKATKLVRIRVSNMNPIKGSLKGEIISAGNAEIGFIKKFIPFNAEQGWHVPQILLTVLQSKKFMTHYEVKVGNRKVKKHKLIPEYSIEILPPLTDKELEALKQRQLMASGQ